VSNPLRILQTLDKYLIQQSEITLFGRAALALGYGRTPDHFHNTEDVDGILPLAWPQRPAEQEDFWQAVQRANAELEADGLYLTHLFREIDVIIQPDWMLRRLRLRLDLPKLTVYRPASIDLILTKMARGDDDDLEDIGFLLKQEPLTRDQLNTAFEQARVPEIPEIQELFDLAKLKVLALLEGLR
jgi:hypothetical protein